MNTKEKEAARHEIKSAPCYFHITLNKVIIIMKETWNGIKKITSYSEPNYLLQANLFLNELNQFHARSDAFGFNKGMADKRTKMNVGKNVDGC